MPYDLTYMWNLTNKTKNRLIDTENKWVVARRGRGWGSEIGKQE